MTPVAVCFVMPHSKQTQAYFLVLSVNVLKQVSKPLKFVRLRNKKSVNYSDLSELTKYYLARKVFLSVIGIIFNKKYFRLCTPPAFITH